MLSALPVIYRPNRPPEHQAVPYKMIKEVRKAVRDYGLHNHFTKNLIEAIAGSSVMTPADWETLLKMILTLAQYTVWATEYNDLVTVQVRDNVTAGLNIGADELLSQGQYSTAQAQAVLNREVFNQAA